MKWMINMKNNDFHTLKQILELDQNQLKNIMYKFLKKKYKNIINHNAYICAEGTIPIALVAHLDTVFSSPPKNIFYDQEQQVMWSPQGLGTDDRAGVFAIIQIVQSGLRPHIILTTDEEVGAIGADLLSRNGNPFADLRYIIQLDRRGNADCVFYDCNNTEFIDYVESFGFAEAYGTFTDISILCPAWKIAGVNLSVGYVNEHSFIETLYLNALNSTINKVKKMLIEEDIPKFDYIAFSNHPMSSFYDVCGICNKPFFTENLIPFTRKDGQLDYICGDCIVDNVSWCALCNHPYEPKNKNVSSFDPKQVNICPICEKERMN